MTTKTPEGKFIRRVGRLLPSDIHSEGMANPYRGGTPDRYYEGNRNCLWAEYKYAKAVPAHWCASGHITGLQKLWIARAQKNHVPVCVIAGFGSHAVVFVKSIHEYWDVPYTREEIKELMLPIDDVAAFIIAHCGLDEHKEKYPH
jgi:hypothetical protein